MWQAEGHLHDPGAAAEDPHHAPVPGHLPHRLPRSRCRSSTRRRWTSRVRRRRPLGSVLGFVSMFCGGNLSQTHASSAWASCRTSRPRSSSSSWPASIRRWRSCKRKARAAARKSTNTPATPPSSSASFQAWYVRQLHHAAAGGRAGWAWPMPGYDSWLLLHRHAVVTMTAGTVFLMWLGEQIDEYGIGNGISLIIMAGIVARMPDATTTSLFFERRQLQAVDLHAWRQRRGGDISFEKLHRADRPVRRRGRGGHRHHQGPAAHPDAVGQARPRPARLRRHAAVPAAAGQPGGRHAGHLRQQPADAPDLRLQAGWPSSPSWAGPCIWPRPSSARATSTTSATSS